MRSWWADNGEIYVRADEAHGGAISQLMWDGTCYLDESDQGRLLQSAIQWDYQGEMHNPTEGGSVTGLPSLVQTEDTSPGAIAGVSQMANWMGGLSDTYYGFIFEIGYQGDPHLIKDTVMFGPQSNHIDAAVELSTAYLQDSFQNLYSLDPATEQLLPLDRVRAFPDSPAWWTHGFHDAIVATDNANHAIALWGPNAGGMFAYYYAEQHTMKLDAWADWGPMQGGIVRTDHVYYAVGSLADVMGSIHHAWLIEHGIQQL